MVDYIFHKLHIYFIFLLQFIEFISNATGQTKGMYITRPFNRIRIFKPVQAQSLHINSIQVPYERDLVQRKQCEN